MDFFSSLLILAIAIGTAPEKMLNCSAESQAKRRCRSLNLRLFYSPVRACQLFFRRFLCGGGVKGRFSLRMELESGERRAAGEESGVKMPATLSSPTTLCGVASV